MLVLDPLTGVCPWSSACRYLVDDGADGAGVAGGEILAGGGVTGAGCVAGTRPFSTRSGAFEVMVECEYPPLGPPALKQAVARAWPRAPRRVAMGAAQLEHLGWR